MQEKDRRARGADGRVKLSPKLQKGGAGIFTGGLSTASRHLPLTAYAVCIRTKSSNRISSKPGSPSDAKISVINLWKCLVRTE